MSSKRDARSRLRAALGAIVLLAAGAWAPPAAAATGAWQGDEAARARLLAAPDASGALETIRAGLEVELGDGWKTYWRSPGDAGLPPRLDWSASENVAAVEMAYPAPHRFVLFGIETVGYADSVLFPLAVRPATPGRPVALRATADLLVCSTVCVPRRFALALDLPAGAATLDEAAAARLSRAASRVPVGDRMAGLEPLALSAGEGGLTLSVASDRPLDGADAFVEGAGARAFGAPEWRRRDGRWAGTLPLVQGDPAAGLDGETLTVTLVDGARAVEATLTVGDPPPAPAPAPAPAAAPGSSPSAASASGSPAAAAVAASGAASVGGLGLLAVLGLGLLGGLVLNVMPCVLPVLSLKLLSVMEAGGRARREIRIGFLATAAGILASFLVLAAILVAVRALGVTVGWGIQFQQPVFVIAMIGVMLLFAGNLAGLFEVRLPAAIARRIGVEGHGLAGHFATGAFATLLATPCSAPFLGTAVGFALAGGPGVVLAVFAALGLGLALPWLAVAAFPGVAARLPRPGPWLRRVRPVLALALAATAVWLVWVLSGQIGWARALVAAGLLGAAVLSVAGLARLARPLRGAAAVAAVALAGTAVAGPLLSPGAPRADPAEPGRGAIAWQPFDPPRIARLVDQGRVVFVDITADWCVTCLVNKAAVLERRAVAEALAGPEVVAMQGDWTAPDPTIAAFLERNGRYGIPFDAVYGPAAPDGIVLPEVLSRDGVLDALARARGDAPAPAADS